MYAKTDVPVNLQWACLRQIDQPSLTVATGELDATKANAATLVAQLQVETADKQQLSTKLADSETIKNELEAKVPFC